MTDAELENRYSYHALFGDQAERYGRIRAKVLETARLIRDHCPDSPERVTALTALDSVMFNANAAIARNEKPPSEPRVIRECDTVRPTGTVVYGQVVDVLSDDRVRVVFPGGRTGIYPATELELHPDNAFMRTPPS